MSKHFHIANLYKSEKASKLLLVLGLCHSAYAFLLALGWMRAVSLSPLNPQAWSGEPVDYILKALSLNQDNVYLSLTVHFTYLIVFMATSISMIAGHPTLFVGLILEVVIIILYAYGRGDFENFEAMWVAISCALLWTLLLVHYVRYRIRHDQDTFKIRE